MTGTKGNSNVNSIPRESQNTYGKYFTTSHCSGNEPALLLGAGLGGH